MIPSTSYKSTSTRLKSFEKSKNCVNFFGHSMGLPSKDQKFQLFCDANFSAVKGVTETNFP